MRGRGFILLGLATSCAWSQAALGAPTGLDANGHFAAVESGKPGNNFEYTRLENGVQVRLGDVKKNVLFYAPDTVRVNANQGKNYWTSPSPVVIAKPLPVQLKITETDTSLTLSSEKLLVEVNKATGALRFLDPAGKLYTQEQAQAPQSLKQVTISGAPSYEAEARLTLQPDEAIYGFGFTDETDQSNRRGKELLLVQTNVGTIIPVMVSSRRYGILWDTYSVMRFADSAEGAKLWAESAPGGVDYYFMGGDKLDDVVSAYRSLTGDAPMYPKQAFGLFMSKERYQTQQRLLEVASTFRKERFPLDFIVQDWQYWGSDKDGTWSGMIWNPERFPDPAGMTRALHDMNLKLMVSIWPSIGNDTALAHELDAHGLRFEPLHWISKKARIYDAFSPLGRQIYFNHIKSGLFDNGVDALWMDGTEVEVGTAAWNPQDNIRDIKSLGNNALGDFSRYLNIYSLMTTMGTYEGRRATSDQRVFTLTRSGWAGAQRTGATSWSGDVFSSWKTLQQSIAGGVNVTVTGNPYWTQDTGGFFVTSFVGGEQNPEWRELFARWFQFGAFNPIMRVHGTSVEREPYIFKTLDPAVYESILDTVQLRYRMLPYIYSLAWQVTASDYTLMRPLVMDFPDDRAVHKIDDSFMFGPALLVHPVTRPMYNIPVPAAATIESEWLRTTDGKPGLSGQYFEGEAFEKPRGETIDLRIDHNWPDPPLAQLPPGLSSLNNFSARWQGTLIAPEDGEYEIGLEGDDGFRLMLDGEKVIEDWSNAAARYRSTNRNLRKGQQVPITIEFFQGGGNRSLRLAWRTPSERRALETSKPEQDLKVQTWLPEGTDWYDFWTNERHHGGRHVTREAPLNIVPLYVRAGSIVPMGPVMQYATELQDAPYEVRIYPGADAGFTIYEDDNETYDYERGEHATYDLAWNDRDRTLTIGARKGGFEGMIPKRQLKIVVMDDSNAGAAEVPATKGVTYSGKEMTVALGR